MIIPNKHIATDRSLLGIGAVILESLDKPRSITTLWRQLSMKLTTCTFENFTLALDFLYAIDAIAFTDGLIRRGEK